ncbi:homeodomain-like superfamily protein [Striga asiatica]|uniref:Homeodomain-like superfamily protein n=1 Tax=Striga asiatica TaxID=4170 RepID=A0A5A7QBK3_STRAF|nr:homeodomain-like superfamily protein [Striga asiatica]
MALDSNKEMSLVLSSDAKPRLKWTQELHQRFVDAVIHLGGPEKATPKSLMRVMGISGLTLNIDWEKANSLICTNTLNSKVQKHLQLRIEAQGKYLQSVLKKAQDTLSKYGACSIEVEQVKAQLSQLASMVDSGCPNSSFSVLTESDSSMLKNQRKNKLSLGHNYGYSVESSLTSSDSSERTKQIQTNNITYSEKNLVVLPLMEMRTAKQETKRRKKCDELKGFDLNCNGVDSS